MKSLLLSAALTFSLFVGSCIAYDSSSNTYAPNNTGKNVRDRDGNLPTADNQSENEADRKIIAKIRSLVVDDKSLSITAKNVKIISNNGRVTLRGPVNSSAESSTIEKFAKSVSGVQSVDNKLEVLKTK